MIVARFASASNNSKRSDVFSKKFTFKSETPLLKWKGKKRQISKFPKVPYVISTDDFAHNVLKISPAQVMLVLLMIMATTEPLPFTVEGDVERCYYASESNIILLRKRHKGRSTFFNKLFARSQM